MQTVLIVSNLFVHATFEFPSSVSTALDVLGCYCDIVVYSSIVAERKAVQWGIRN